MIEIRYNFEITVTETAAIFVFVGNSLVTVIPLQLPYSFLVASFRYRPKTNAITAKSNTLPVTVRLLVSIQNCYLKITEVPRQFA